MLGGDADDFDAMRLFRAGLATISVAKPLESSYTAPSFRASGQSGMPSRA